MHIVFIYLFSFLLSIVYTMDHEVIPRPCEICKLLNSSQDHLWLLQGKMVDKVTMEFEVHKIYVFKAYIIHWHGPINFVVGEAKHVFLKEKAKSLWAQNGAHMCWLTLWNQL